MADARLIQIVEDDDAVRASTRALLEAQGYAVREFSSAEEYLAADDGQGADCQGADCLVLDINLPGLSGLDMLEQLRARGVQIPVIIVSANGRDMAARAARLGVMAVLRKPLAADALLQWLEQLFSAKP